MNQLVVCTLIAYDGQYMTCQDYNDPEAIFYEVMIGQKRTGSVKTQNLPEVGELVLIGIDDEERAHFIHAIYTEINPRPFSDTNKIGIKKNNDEISYDPDSSKVIVSVDSIELAEAVKSAVTFEDLKAILDTIITIFNTHIHAGVLVGGASTAIPTQTIITDTNSIKSQNVKLS